MRIVVLTNILTPYRIDFFNKINNQMESLGNKFNVIVMAEKEPNREWEYSDYKEDYTHLLKNKTITFKGIYIHLNKDVRRTLEEYNPDVVICAGSYLHPTVWRAIKYSKKLNYQILFWSETHLNEERNYSSMVKFIRERIRHIVYKKFDGFLYAGELSKKFINKYMKTNAKLFFLPNTVENEKYENGYTEYKSKKDSLRIEYGIEPNKYVFFTPARLTSVKGIDKLLEMCKSSKEKRKAVFLVAGNGEQYDELIELAKQNEVDLRLLGYKEQEEIIKLYALADCFLLPSISDPNPLTVIEALWSGLPLLLSSNVGNYPETIKIGENGFVFKHNGKEKAVELIDKLIISDKTWRDNASKVSLEIARQHYTSKLVIDNLLEQLSNEYAR